MWKIIYDKYIKILIKTEASCQTHGLNYIIRLTWLKIKRIIKFF